MTAIAGAAALAFPAATGGAPYVATCLTPNPVLPAAFANPDLNPGASRSVNGVNGGSVNIDGGFPIRGVTHEHRTVRYSRAALYRAHLTNLDGHPVIAARVWLAVADCRGQWAREPQPLITDADGQVTIRLPARQPPRSIRLLYYPYTDISWVTSNPTLRLTVRSAAALSANRRRVPAGGRVRLTARLVTPVTPGTTILGQLQLRADGRWRPFRQVRFAAGDQTKILLVRFRRSPPGTRYQMRLRIPPQNIWPWAAGRSQTVRLLIG